MAAQITAVLTNLLIVQECRITIEITGLNSQNHLIIETPGIFPLSESSVDFRFEALYQSIEVPNENKDEYDLFKLILIKRVDYTIPSTLKLNVDVAILYSDYSVFRKYEPLQSINVADMENIRFEDALAPLRWLYIFNSEHYNKMLKKTLILECHFVFFDDSSPLALLHDREVLSLNNLRTFNQEFSHSYKPLFQAEVEFHVGNKIVLSHRSVLIAHSPVLKKILLSSDFKVPFVIVLFDVSYESCDCFVKYMYTGEIECKSWPSVKDLYVLSIKYEVRTLKTDCSYLIASYLSFDQVCEVLKLAYAYGDEELKKTSKQYAVIHFRELVSKKEWKELITSNPIIGHEVMKDVILKSHCELN